MNNQIKTYYIPNNPNIKKGPIYNIYKNNINNLNLSSILQKEKTITIKETEYNKLLDIITEYNNIITEKNNNIRNLVTEENKSTNKLLIINKKKQELTQKLSKGE